MSESTSGVTTTTILGSDYDVFDAWLHKIYESTQPHNWFMPPEDIISTGVCLRAGVPDTMGRVGASSFRVFPYENTALVPFEAAVRALNPIVAVKIKSAAVKAALGKTKLDDTYVQIDTETRIQIIESVDWLPRAEKDQRAAFVRDDSSLILWSAVLEDIIPLCKDIEERLIKHIWRTRNVGVDTATSSESVLALGVNANVNAETKSSMQSSTGTRSRWWSWRISPRASKEKITTTVYNGDPEKGEIKATEKSKRKLILLGPIYAGLGAGLAVYFCTAGLKLALIEYTLDGDPRRFGLLVTLPFIFCVSLFFCLQLVGNISLILGPVAQYHQNSKYYSAIKPSPNPSVDNNLPHITVQMPVYKESLPLTIAPSILSIKKAMQTYARQGGTSALFVCDDGMQCLQPEEQTARVAFYADHDIGWVARPPHGAKGEGEGEGFKRRGKFKKASNMNYGLKLSLKLEKFLAQLVTQQQQEQHPSSSSSSPRGSTTSASSGGYHQLRDQDQLEEEPLEDRAMRLAQEEMYEESGWKPWCANGKSLRVGEVLLIVDADTVVPEDCFRDAAREMASSPEVAIIQHESDVMQVAHHYFENGITHFTRRINKCISFGCANGEVAPFVGHNAFLRWSAMQDAAFVDEEEAQEGVQRKEDKKIWSESNVSEDFDMALRLLLKGYTLRWATYSEGGFKEGVSLTVVDELARWQKYAYGCNEIIFTPLVKWWRHGPISKQLRNFVWSKAPVHYKIGMMAYMFSYYGIAAATIGSILNYLLLGLSPSIDQFYLHSFEILLACVVVFPCIGNIGFTLLEYRLGQRSFSSAAVENVRWIPFFVFFFGGLSIHLSTALLAHMFSYDMTWGSTGKEVERSTFWIEVPRIWHRFKLSFIICFLCIAMMIVFASDIVPFEWQINAWDYGLVVPLALCVGCHILLPIVLNPWLMIFSY